jgi:tRNA-dihydrouridine synthase B
MMLPITTIFTRDRAALAPLSGITNSVFRRICIGFGARPVMTEMISSEGYVRSRQNMKTQRLLNFHESERPIGFQFFGADPGIMAEAVSRANSLKPDFVDINAGCPMKKIVSSGCGSALLSNLSLLKQIVERVVRISSAPVTVKIRSGWDQTSINAVDVARMCEDIGVSLIIIHPRTRSQGFSGQADWSLIRKVKESISIPVVGSGDITSPERAISMFKETGADGIMIGRAALGNPWIFQQTSESLRGENPQEPPGISERLTLALYHLELVAEEVNERYAVLTMRKFFGWYSRGANNGAIFRQAIFHAESIEEVKKIVSEFLSQEYPCGAVPANDVV